MLAGQLSQAAAHASTERRLQPRESGQESEPFANWRIQVETSFTSEAWKAAVRLCGADFGIGILAISGASRRGMVFSSGCSRNDLGVMNIEALRAWFDGQIRESEQDQAELRLITSASEELSQITRLDWLASVQSLVMGRMPAEEEGMFYLLLGRRTGMPLRDAETERFGLACQVLAQCAVTHAASARREKRLHILEGLLDQMAPSLTLVDARGCIFWNNSRAEYELSMRDTIIRGSNGCIAALTADDTHALRVAIKRAALGERDASGGFVREIGDQFLMLPSESGQDRLVVIRPVLGRRDANGNRAVMLIIHGPDQTAQPSNEVLFQALGLIPSEARFVGAILEAGSSADAAQRLGLSQSTARTYLKRIYAKLGVNNQFELASLVRSFLPPLSNGQQVLQKGIR